jgi:hypothetical protein
MMSFITTVFVFVALFFLGMAIYSPFTVLVRGGFCARLIVSASRHAACACNVS